MERFPLNKAQPVFRGLNYSKLGSCRVHSSLLLLYVRAASEPEINPSWMGPRQDRGGAEEGGSERLRFTALLTTSSPSDSKQEEF